MATVEVFTKARMQAIEDEAIVDSRIDTVGEERQLILIRNNGVEINAGNVRGPIGITPTLPTIPDELDWSATNVNGPIVGGAAPGGSGAAPLKMQAGSNVIATTATGRALISFAEPFNGLAAVVAQIGDTNTFTYNHLNGIPVGDHTIRADTCNVTTETYAQTGFHVTIAVPPVTDAFGVLAPPVTVGGINNIRINWMAFGW